MSFLSSVFRCGSDGGGVVFCRSNSLRFALACWIVSVGVLATARIYYLAWLYYSSFSVTHWLEVIHARTEAWFT